MKKFLTVLVATFAATVAFAQPPMGGPGGFGGFGGEDGKKFDPEEMEAQMQKIQDEMNAGAYKPTEAEANAKEMVVHTQYASKEEASQALIEILNGEGYTLLTESKSRVYGYRNPSATAKSMANGMSGMGGFPGGGFPGGGMMGGPGGGFPGGGMPGGMMGGSSRPNEIDAKITGKPGDIVITFYVPKPAAEEEDQVPNETGRIVKLIPNATIELIPR